jgi:hypothetical protein
MRRVRLVITRWLDQPEPVNLQLFETR